MENGQTHKPTKGKINGRKKLQNERENDIKNLRTTTRMIEWMYEWIMNELKDARIVNERMKLKINEWVKQISD